jgi:uncharacterized surface anchored protein
MANTTITVQDSTGVVLSGATVSYDVNSVAVEGTTDSNGQLVISDLAAGTYDFTAALSGYTGASVDVTVDGTTDATGTITMTAELTCATTVKSEAITLLATAAVTYTQEYIAALKVKVQAKIDASHSWEKLGWEILLLLLSTGSDKLIAYVESKLS